MSYFLDIVKKLEYKSNEERKNIIIKILKSKILEKQNFSGRRKSKAFSNEIKFRLEEYDHQRNLNFSGIKDSVNYPIRDKPPFFKLFCKKRN